MILTRRLVFPTLAFFALVLIGLVWFFASNLQSVLQSEAQRVLDGLNQALNSELSAEQNLVIGLANSSANDPQVQESFANQDRSALLNASQPVYQKLQTLFDLPQFLFHLPTATVFLNLNDPEAYGQDQTLSRLTVTTSNLQKLDIAGIELAENGLGIHGVVPVNYQGSHVGSLDLGLKLGSNLVTKLKTTHGGDWQLFISREQAKTAGYPLSAGQTGSDASISAPPDLALEATTLLNPIYAPLTAYESALNGESIASQVETQDKVYAILSVPLRDFSGKIIGVMDILIDQTQALAELNQRLTTALLVSLAGLVVGGMGLAFIIRRSLRPLGDLSTAAAAVARGDLSQSVKLSTAIRSNANRPVEKRDEVEQLAHSFNIMTQEMRTLVSNLEQRVADRTQDLERRSNQLRTASEIARDLTTTYDLDDMLNQATRMVRDRFGFYHVGIFLLDERREYAVLRAATGEAGRKMLERHHQLRVGQVGIVGAATGTGRPHIALDVGSDAVHFKNPLLPETRSEMALPLHIGDRVIGALDVQSRQPAAFDEGDIAVLQIMADQLAVAIENARLIDQLNESVRELEQASTQYTQESWRSFLGGSGASAHKAGTARRHITGYRYYRTSLEEIVDKETTDSPSTSGQADAEKRRLPPAQSPLGRQVIQTGQTVIAQADNVQAVDVYTGGNGNEPDGDPDRGDSDRPLFSQAAFPIKLRGQVIGVVELQFNSPSVPSEMITLVEEATSRLGLVLESTRLLQEAQRLATREQQINLIANRIRSSVDMETILQNTVQELGRVLGASRAFIAVQPDEKLPDDQAAHSSQQEAG